MSSLSERLRAKKAKVEPIEIDGETYIVTSKSKGERGRLFATARRKDGTLNNERLESILLAACVTDETGAAATMEDWDATQSYITGPLMTKIMSLNGFDKDDVKDPKDSDSTES